MSYTATVERKEKRGGIFGTTLMIAGASMGGGMLGIPILTGLGGFFPGILMTTVIWLCMLATALLIVEITLALPNGSNMASLAEHFFGPIGKYFVGIPYLIFYFFIVFGYESASGTLLVGFLKDWTGVALPAAVGHLIIVILLFFPLYFGTLVADRINRILMVGFFATFLFILFRGAQQVQAKNLMRFEWTFMFLSGPILFAAFSFHNLIPTLVTYLDRNVRALRTSIFLGMGLTYVCYILWQIDALGAISQGKFWEAYEKGGPVTESFRVMSATSWLGQVAFYFAFFATSTSLLGASLGMIDFIADGLKIDLFERYGRKRFVLCLILLVPSLILSSLFPRVFFKAIGYAGGFGIAILNAGVPVWMAWKSRYQFHSEVPKLVPGKRPLLLTLLVVTFYIIYLQGIMLLQ